MGPQGATRRSACPVLRHSESGDSVPECGATGSASGQTACPVQPTLHQSWSRHRHVSPLCPGARLCPSYQSGCMFLFFIYLVSDFLAIRFSVSSGCARRRSVSIYAAILVLCSKNTFLSEQNYLESLQDFFPKGYIICPEKCLCGC